MSISIIVGTSENGVIGYSNEIPWHLPRDLKHFALITKGHSVLMGRKTYESIIRRLGHPLPERKNVILTRQKDFKTPGCVVVHSWDEVAAETKGEEIFVCGGADIYKLALPFADKIYLTVVHTVLEGDVYFNFDKSQWIEISKEFHPRDEKNEFDCTFYEYEKRK